jgi:hypothetical protein
MRLRSDDSPEEPKQTILQKVIFFQFKDDECDVLAWRYREEDPYMTTVSNRSFDTIQEAIQAWQENRDKQDQF